MHNHKINTDYLTILENGFSVKITSQHSGWSYLYVKNDRIQLRVTFRSNNQSSESLSSKLGWVSKKTHLGRALAEAVDELEFA
jgi:regulation of enolase protein 1 (concanavalin A-like superfamily)